MSIPFLSKLSRVAAKQSLLAKTCNPINNPRVHALIQPVASSLPTEKTDIGYKNNGHAMIDASCCCCNAPFFLRYFSSSSSSSDGGESVKNESKQVQLKVEEAEQRYTDKNDGKLPPPACASFNQELATSPLNEHKNGLNLSRQEPSKPISDDDVPLPQSETKKNRKPKEEEDQPTPDTTSTSPSTSKSHGRKRAKDRLETLNRKDCERRLMFTYKLLLAVEDSPEILDNILWTDECNFNLPKLPNLITKPPVAESELLPQIAWCGISTKGTVGPYFFNSHVTDKSYLKMLESYLIPELEKKGYNLKELWFQQDGAPWHRSKPVIDFLTSVFNDRIISLGTMFIWPPRSQDLTPMDYFFWDYMKIKLDFKHSKYDLCFQKGFRDILTREVNISSVNALQGAIYQLPERLEMCLNENGGRFVHLLYPERFEKDGSRKTKKEGEQLANLEKALSIAKIAANCSTNLTNLKPTTAEKEAETVLTNETTSTTVSELPQNASDSKDKESSTNTPKS